MSVKPVKIAFLAFALSIFASTAYCSDIMGEVIKLQRAGIDNEIILHYVQDSNSSADLSADDIQRLEDVGVSSTVVVAMLDRSKELRDDPTRIHTAAPADPFAAQPQVVASADVDAEVVAPPDGQADISLFYEALSPYGTWTQDADNGWVWEPTDAVRDQEWRPYANDGHWTSTDQGWYWESASPYGWATYHYGRWGYNSRHRWSWSPDNVWGPAWVDWRHSDDYIGWAPLPFGSRFEAGRGFNYRGRNEGFNFHAGIEEREFAFVSSNAFLNVNLRSSFVPENRRHNVYTETKIINNTYVYNDNRVINNGVPVAVVSRQTKREIQQVKIVDANIAAGQPIRGDRRKDNAIAAYRPKIEAKASVEPPAIVERRKLAASRNPGTTKNVETTPAPAAVARETAVTQRKDNAEVEKQSRQRLQEEKQKRATGKQVENKQNAADNKQNADDRRNANQEAAKDKKAEGVSARDAQEKVRADAAEARKTSAAAERESKAKETQAATTERKEAREENTAAAAKQAEERRKATDAATAARKSAADAATNDRKEARDAVKDTKDNAREENAAAAAKQAEERRNANDTAATARKSAAEAEAKVRADAAKERKSDAADAKEAKDAAREDKKDDRKEKRDEKNNGKDK